MKKSLNNYKVKCQNNGQWQVHKFNTVIPYGEVFTFKIYIRSMPSFNVGIGVIDYEEHKDTFTDPRQQN